MAQLKDTTITGNIKITSELLATPVAGTIEFDNDKFYITDVAHQRAIDRTSDVATSSVSCANTTTETTLWTGDIDANDLKVGNVLKCEGYGQISSDSASDVCTLRVYIGATKVAELASPGKILSSDCWNIEFKSTVRTCGATGVLSRFTKVQIENDENRACGTTTLDTTVAENITITAQWNNAKAGNTLGLGMAWLEFKN